MLSDYQLLDSGQFEKLEQIGPYRLIRPALQACWQKSLDSKHWKQADAFFQRDSSGTGKWKSLNSKLPGQWIIGDDIRFVIKPTDFGHLGIFPEHLMDTSYLKEAMKQARQKPLRILNLFAYTGGLSLFAAKLGYHVTHVDASKKSISWAKENTKESNLQDSSIRWIHDDVGKFVKREIKRENQYDAIILDPPTYGRGTRNEIWKIDDHLVGLLVDLKKLCSSSFQFLYLSCHTPGYTPLCLKNLISDTWHIDVDQISSDELFVSQKASKKRLPSGCYAKVNLKLTSGNKP